MRELRVPSPRWQERKQGREPGFCSRTGPAGPREERLGSGPLRLREEGWAQIPRSSRWKGRCGAGVLSSPGGGMVRPRQRLFVGRRGTRDTVLFTEFINRAPRRAFHAVLLPQGQGRTAVWNGSRVWSSPSHPHPQPLCRQPRWDPPSPTPLPTVDGSSWLVCPGLLRASCSGCHFHGNTHPPGATV